VGCSWSSAAPTEVFKRFLPVSRTTSLEPHRARAYTCGAFAGAWSALAIVSEKQRTTVLFVVLAAVSGLLSVRYEERPDWGV